MRYSLRFLLLFGLAFPFSLVATTIIPYKNLAELYLASDAVVQVQSGASYEVTENGRTHSNCEFTVMISAKGSLSAGDVFTLRQYSAYDPIGRLDIAGDFIPKPDRNYLMFLDENDGSWRLMLLSYYVFEESLKESDHYFVPVNESLSMGVFPRPDGVIPEPLTAYRAEALMQLLQQQGKGPYVPWDASSAQAAVSISELVSDRALPTGCDFDLGLGLSRWQNPAISMYYDVTNAPADAAERYQSMNNTMNTEYPGLDLVYSGSTDFTPNCMDNSVAGQDFIDFLNNNLNGTQSMLLLFDDPCNNIPDLSNCAGTLAIGGGYMLSSTHVYKGDTWKNAAWGYVVLNNGVRNCMTATNYERLLSHEFSHALKMDHLSAALYPNNNMNPTCCNAIGPKDRECMNYVYDLALPVELIAFDARVLDDAVELRWSTAQEKNNDYFSIERSADGRQFLPLAQVAGRNADYTTAYTLTDAQPLTGLSYYRLSQVDRDGQMEQLALRAVTHQGKDSGYALVPNPVNGNAIFLTSGAREPGFESLQIFNPTGQLIYQMQGQADWNANRLELPIGDLPPGIYWLQVTASSHSETLKFVRR